MNEQNDHDLYTLCVVDEMLSDRDEIQRLYQLVCEESLLHLTILADGLLANASDALFELARNETDQALLEALFNCMRGLKQNSGNLVRGFTELVRVSWKEKGGVGLPEISLPGIEDDSDASVDALIRCMARKTRLLYTPLLRDLEHSFGIGEANGNLLHPLDPVFVTRLFWASTSCLALTHNERMLVLPLFRRFVLDSYGQVLAPVHTILSVLTDDSPAPMMA